MWKGIIFLDFFSREVFVHPTKWFHKKYMLCTSFPSPWVVSTSIANEILPLVTFSHFLNNVKIFFAEISNAKNLFKKAHILDLFIYDSHCDCQSFHILHISCAKCSSLALQLL